MRAHSTLSPSLSFNSPRKHRPNCHCCSSSLPVLSAPPTAPAYFHSPFSHNYHHWYPCPPCLPPARHSADHRRPSKSALPLSPPTLFSILPIVFHSPTPDPYPLSSPPSSLFSRLHNSLGNPPGDILPPRFRSSPVWKSTSPSTSSNTPLSTAVPSCFSD